MDLSKAERDLPGQAVNSCQGTPVITPDFKRRIGASPRQRGSLDGNTCPDIVELTDGSFAVIGADRTHALTDRLPADAGRSRDERIVVITR
ncbi:hypothetical protein ACIG3E_38750 [Streptomyces sp. NPDC053474]|uniref:hypothetical protein n=1 Tax=Streptomyces sp. NPDC053474 TaxID=3365704 RepID=UPI0037D3A877